MVTMPALLIPVALSAIAAFFASFVLWVMLPHHKGDYRPLPDEQAVLNALGEQALEPAFYVLPFAHSQKAMTDPGFREKVRLGPAANLIVVPPESRLSMTRALWRQFAFYLVAFALVAYLARLALPAGEDYLVVFRFVGTAAWATLGFGVIPNSIFWGFPWPQTWKTLADTFLISLVVAGVFGWLWPA
jgi:hypothetical protein